MAQSSIENILQEPAAAYATTGSRLDLVTLSRRGVKKQALLNLGKQLNLNLKELAALLPVTARTLQRRKADSLLGTAVSEHIILIAELAEKGSEIFSGIESFNKWLREENTALGSHRPLDLLDTAIGVQLVSEELGKLEYGVYS
ncbi:MAG TPA: antitoxin Xre/MbcA/ParS toxin-binding domain-containing protein [Balneolaceae bacterium]|nr:antitoxin Xre/MbcA/ParS toxin-binding domain-containing protein [Balneolaceae bacterium]